MRSALKWGCLSFASFTLAAVLIDAARAEVPPIIIGVREAMRDARRVLEDTSAPSRASPVVGECRELPEAVDELLPTQAERELVERQVAACSRRPGRRADVWGLLALWRLEAQLGVPEEARGLLGATYCVEAGAMRGERRGDWRDGVARAHGPLQLWPWAYRACGLVDGARDDLEAAARCYWSRVEARVGACAGSWRVAEAMVANAPRYASWGCRAESAHWRAMEGAR
jgi:hypothetical protein